MGRRKRVLACRPYGARDQRQGIEFTTINEQAQESRQYIAEVEDG
jgi:hypothetical protein